VIGETSRRGLRTPRGELLAEGRAPQAQAPASPARSWWPTGSTARRRRSAAAAERSPLFGAQRAR